MRVHTSRTDYRFAVLILKVNVDTSLLDQETDVEHVLYGLTERFWVDDELEVVQTGISACYFEDLGDLGLGTWT